LTAENSLGKKMRLKNMWNPKQFIEHLGVIRFLLAKTALQIRSTLQPYYVQVSILGHQTKDPKAD
jgi:Na+/melibiose symporter-like transporter